MKRKTTLVAAVSAALFSVTVSAAELARVGKSIITEEAFRESAEALGPRAQGMLANPQLRRQFLDHLIDSQLLSVAAEKVGIEKSPEFKRRLEEARRQILAGMYVDQYVVDNTKEEHVKAYFDKNKDSFSKMEIKASHILLKDEAQAKKVLELARKKGADFAALAKEHSTGPSGPRGGDLGYFGKGRMVPAFEEAAFATKKGEVHPKVVKTQFGYHIIKVEDIRGEGEVKYEDVKDEAKQRLEHSLRENLIKDLRAKSEIKVNQEALDRLQF